MAGCGGCAAAKARRAAERAAASSGNSTGTWELVPLDGPPTYYDNRLAAMAADRASGGGGIIRQAPQED